MFAHLRLFLLVNLLLTVLTTNAQSSLTKTYKQLAIQVEKLSERGNYQEAIPIAEKAIKLAEKKFGQHHATSAEALNNLANLYEKMGQYKKALPLYKQCLTIREKAFGKQHSKFATSLDDLALLYADMGQHEKALPLYQQALNIYGNVVGKQSFQYAFTLNNLANLYEFMGQYQKALPLLQESLIIRERTLGKHHPDYAATLNNLAGLYEDMGQYEKALPLYMQDLAITEKVLGKQHPDYGTTLNNLAGLYEDMGQYEKALPLYKQDLAITAKALGKWHPDYAATLNNLAELYQEMGQYEKALPLYKQDLAITEKTLGKQHPSYSTTLNNLANLYKSMGHYQRALSLYVEGRNIRKNAQGNQHPFYATTLNNLAELYLSIGQYQKALPLFVESKGIREKVLGKQHPSYATTLNNLAGLYLSTGQYQKALPLVILSRQQYKIQLLQNIAIINETSLSQFQQKLDRADEAYSLGYIARARGLFGQHYNDALLSKGVGLLATQQLNNLLTQTTDTTTTHIVSQLRETKQILNRQYSLPLANQRGVDSLERWLGELEQTLVLRLPEYGRAFEALRVEWPQVQQQLKPDEAAVEFVSFQYYHKHKTDSTLYIALVLRPDWSSPRSVFLGEQRQLDSLLTTGSASSEDINQLYRGAKAEGNNDGQLARGIALSRLIWQPLDSLLQGVQTVFVAPSGRLHQLALAALPNPADTSHHSRMADRFQIRQVGSTRIVALRNAQTERPLVANTLRTTLYGGIIYDADSASLVRQARKQLVEQRVAYREATRSGEWNYLPGTQIEVDSIRQLLPVAQTTSFTREVATEASLKALSGHAPMVLHIATHGFFFSDLKQPNPDQLGLGHEQTRFEVAENPLLRSGLVLAGANYVWKGGKPIDGVEDGILTAYEVSNLNLSGTELVVLSACETGLGQVKGSEGVYGLQRAFKMAGVRYLLMSLWRVSDKETAEYMTLFYRKLLKTGSVPAAYAYAQNQMRSQYPLESFKWAAFVLVE